MSWFSDSNPHTRNISRTSAAFGPMWRFTNRSVHANGRVAGLPSARADSAALDSGAKVVSDIKRGEGMARTPRGKKKMLAETWPTDAATGMITPVNKLAEIE